MAAAVSGLRAKRGYIKTKRYDAAGRVVNARDHTVTGGGGILSAKEMEREMAKVADQVGASPDQVVIEVYGRGEAPIEVGRDRPAQRHINKNQTVPMGDVPAYRSNFDRAFGRTS